MFSKLKTAWSGLFGPAAEPPVEPVEYKGYRILPTPYLNNTSYQTAGTIEKDTPEGVKRHKFVRADTYDNYDDAVAFTLTKAKQLIDQQGDGMFR